MRKVITRIRENKNPLLRFNWINDTFILRYVFKRRVRAYFIPCTLTHIIGMIFTLIACGLLFCVFFTGNYYLIGGVVLFAFFADRCYVCKNREYKHDHSNCDNFTDKYIYDKKLEDK